MQIKTEEISSTLLKEKKVRLFIKRIDAIHQHISGNKWYKLKYNLLEAKKQNKNTLITFGGAYSNHIAATASAAKENNFRSIGIIRGEEHLPLNPTLKFAKEQGMEIHYISRAEYKLKNTEEFIDNLKEKFGDFYLIPEGGTNELAIKGTAEIISENDTQDFICCAVGTGGTISGIINASNPLQKVIGFPAIKGFELLQKDVESWTDKKNFELINNYVYGGYAKTTKQLIDFINEFYLAHHIPLDAVYTGKMMMGIMDLVAKDYFPKGSSILAIHTGGLQGNKGMSERLGLSLPTN
jgi:1-aminocyclopropane-1-carboxylate deaminase